MRKLENAERVFEIGDVKVGGELVIIAGPCAVENRMQLFESVRIAKECGAKMMRGGAFKPRTHPYSFQGMGEEGIKLLAEAKKEFGMPIVTEITCVSQIPLMESYGIDVYQIGSRNCQNYELLKWVAKIGKPVLLKRGAASTIDELIGSAEYLIANGARKIMLCERGIKTFNDAKDYRNTLDVNAVIYLRQNVHVPVIGDPSHGTGNAEMVLPASRALVGAGAQGLIIEVHYRPETALCDGKQSVKDIKELSRQCESVYRISNT